MSEEELCFEDLQAEAEKLGVHYAGNDPLQLFDALEREKAKRSLEKPTPCFKVLYNPTFVECRICDKAVRVPCSQSNTSLQVEVLDKALSSLPCEVCKTGTLSVELVDPDTREVKDCACTTPGCLNSLAVQVGWGYEGAVEAPTVDEEEIAAAEQEEEVAEVIEEVNPVVEVPKETKPKIKVTILKPAQAPGVKPVTVKTAELKIDPSALAYRWEGKTFPAISQVIKEITGCGTISAKKFFGVAAKDVTAGQVLKGKYKGQEVSVEVIHAG